jgi:hypothetical protein
MAGVSASAQLIRSPTDRTRLQAFVYSRHASARVRANPTKLSLVAAGTLA